MLEAMSVKFPFHASKPWPTERTGLSCQQFRGVSVPRHLHGHLHGRILWPWHGSREKPDLSFGFLPCLLIIGTIWPVNPMHFEMFDKGRCCTRKKVIEEWFGFAPFHSAF